METVRVHPLARFLKLRTADPEQLRLYFSELFSVRSIDLPRGGGPLNAVLSHRQMKDVGLSFARYGTP